MNNLKINLLFYSEQLNYTKLVWLIFFKWPFKIFFFTIKIVSHQFIKIVFRIVKHSLNSFWILDLRFEFSPFLTLKIRILSIWWKKSRKLRLIWCFFPLKKMSKIFIHKYWTSESELQMLFKNEWNIGFKIWSNRTFQETTNFDFLMHFINLVY